MEIGDQAVKGLPRAEEGPEGDQKFYQMETSWKRCFYGNLNGYWGPGCNRVSRLGDQKFYKMEIS